jgi:signal transduction histidine kinase
MVQIRAFYPPWNRWFENRIYPSADGLSIFFQDVTEEQEREEQLQASTDELRALSTRLEEIREEERRLLARELHDQVGQALTALRLDLGWLNGKLATDRELHARLAAMEKLLDDTLETTRRLSADLRPSLLDDLGLAAALAWQAQDFETRTGIPCELEIADQDASGIEPILGLALYRVLQEAMTNIVRHADAKQVKVRLEARREAGRDELVLTVIDDGRGMPRSGRSRPGALGLIGMRERLTALGGRLTITSSEGQGTTLEARLPRSTRKVT